MMNTNTHSSVWTTANFCTITRVALLPVLVPLYLSEHFLPSFFLMSLIGFSDVLDGWIARRTNTASTLGATLDVAADCVTIFVIQGFLLATGDWSLYLLVLSLLSIVLFSLHAWVKGHITKTRLGRYTGAVLVTSFLIVTLGNAIHPTLGEVITPIIGLLVAMFLILAIVENLGGLYLTIANKKEIYTALRFLSRLHSIAARGGK